MMFDIGFDLTLCSEMCTRVLRAARHQSFKRAARQVCTRHQRWCKYTFGFIDTQHLLTGHFIRYHILASPHLLLYASIGTYIIYILWPLAAVPCADVERTDHTNDLAAKKTFVALARQRCWFMVASIDQNYLC